MWSGILLGVERLKVLRTANLSILGEERTVPYDRVALHRVAEVEVGAEVEFE